jgi:hypothetical protein
LGFLIVENSLVSLEGGDGEEGVEIEGGFRGGGGFGDGDGEFSEDDGLVSFLVNEAGFGGLIGGFGGFGGGVDGSIDLESIPYKVAVSQIRHR